MQSVCFAHVMNKQYCCTTLALSAVYIYMHLYFSPNVVKISVTPWAKVSSQTALIMSVQMGHELNLLMTSTTERPEWPLSSDLIMCEMGSV